MNKKEPPKRKKIKSDLIENPNNNSSKKVLNHSRSIKKIINNSSLDSKLNLNSSKKTIIKLRKKTKINNNNSIINIYPSIKINSKRSKQNTQFQTNENKKLSKEELKKIRKFCGDINFEEFLSQTLDEMEFEDALKNDKRGFCEFYINRIQDNQMLIETFYNKEKIRPISIKMILFLLIIDLHFMINALFFSSDYISERFHDTNEEKFYSFIPRSLNRFLYTGIASSIVDIIMNCILIEPKKVKGILLREKDNPLNLKSQMSVLGERIKSRNWIFIIITLVIMSFSWYYISCFNNVYPYTKKEWVKSSIFFIIIKQLSPAFFALIEGMFRFLSFHFKSEKLFKFSKILS